jgi:probable rRNA maturation factor
MLDVALSFGAAWPDGDEEEWQRRCAAAVAAAIGASPHAMLIDGSAMIEVSVRLADDAEVQALNAQWRGRNKSTNVLSFPSIQPDLIDVIGNSDDGEILLGDIILARETCAAEAAGKGIALPVHATHLVVHGTLHLLGEDHIAEADALRMEDMERAAMAMLGYDDPYRVIGDE